MKSPLAYLYTRLSGEPLSEGMKSFFTHLQWIANGFFIAKAIGFAVTIAAARFLGPLEYGKVSLSIDVATLLYAFSLWGTHSSLPKHGAPLAGTGGFPVMAASGLVIPAIGLAATGVLAAFAAEPIARALGVTAPIVRVGWAFSAGYTVFLTFTSLLQAQHRMKERGWMEVVMGLAFAGLFAAGAAAVGRTFVIVSGAMAGGYALAGAATALLTRSQWNARPRLDWVGRHFHYGTYGLGQSLTFFCLANLQRLLLNVFISTREVGVYAAYHVSSVGQAFYAANALSILLLPRSSATSDRAELWAKVLKGWAVLGIPVGLGVMAFETATLHFLGRERFGFEPERIVLFALAALAIMIHGSFASTLAAEGPRGARFVLAVSMGMAFLNAFLGALSIPAWGVAGAAAAVLTAYVLGAAALWAGHRRYM